jgi:hypothetical protein
VARALNMLMSLISWHDAWLNCAVFIYLAEAVKGESDRSHSLVSCMHSPVSCMHSPVSCMHSPSSCSSQILGQQSKSQSNWCQHISFNLFHRPYPHRRHQSPIHVLAIGFVMFEAAVSKLNDILTRHSWVGELAGILPLSALIDFIDVPRKFHVLQLAGAVPLWNWPVTPSGSRILLSKRIRKRLAV